MLGATDAVSGKSQPEPTQPSLYSMLAEADLYAMSCRAPPARSASVTSASLRLGGGDLEEETVRDPIRAR